MGAPKNKFSRDGFEVGASKIGVIVLGQDNFGRTRESLRQTFVEIRKNPDVIPLDNAQFQDAADRGNYLENGLLQWVSDKLDKLCEGGNSVSMHKPTDGFRLPKYKICASLDGILEVHGDKIPFTDPQTGKVIWLEGKGVCEIKTQGYNDGPPSYENILQVQTQMLCSGFKWAIIGKLGPRLKFSMYVYQADPAIHEIIKEKISDFWNKVENDIPYITEEDTDKTYDDWSGNDRGITQMVADYQLADSEIKKWTDTKDQLKDAIRSIMVQENCNYVQIDNKRIASELITRKATVEKLVPAKPQTQYEKFTVKDINND